jgi:hypothetical protein
MPLQIRAATASAAPSGILLVGIASTATGLKNDFRGQGIAARWFRSL